MKALLTTAASTLALIGVIWGGMVTLDSRYAAMSDLKTLTVEVLYNSYNDNRDRLREAEARGDEEYARELRRRLEQIRAKICAHEPTWERCDE